MTVILQKKELYVMKMRIFYIKVLTQSYKIRKTKQHKFSSFTQLLQWDFKEVRTTLYLTERKRKEAEHLKQITSSFIYLSKIDVCERKRENEWEYEKIILIAEVCTLQINNTKRRHLLIINKINTFFIYTDDQKCYLVCTLIK